MKTTGLRLALILGILTPAPVAQVCPADAGVLEIGRTDEMFAVAEVYETEIGRVELGQRALVSSPALASPLEGTVERIGLKVGKLDVLGTDPVAKTDARVVEVDIRLDDGARVSHLTNLQVEVSLVR